MKRLVSPENAIRLSAVLAAAVAIALFAQKETWVLGFIWSSFAVAAFYEASLRAKRCRRERRKS